MQPPATKSPTSNRPTAWFDSNTTSLRRPATLFPFGSLTRLPPSDYCYDDNEPRSIIGGDRSEALMDEATDKYDAPEKRTLRIAGLCICAFAASLGLISL